MNRTSKAVSVAAALLCVAGTGCTDPTVAPKSTVTSANVFNDPNSYRAFLAKIYGGLIVTGQRGPDGNADIGGIDEGFGEYLRLYWYLQEMPTDEAVIGWNDPGLPTLNTGTWGASNEMVNAMYYRVFYQVMVANGFWRQSTDAKLAERNQNDPTLRTNIQFYRAEARFLRALSYWHGIDLFGNIPLVTEADPLGATPPKQATRDSLYRYVVSELNAIKDELPPRGADTYGRATPAAAHMLLAKLYLNAGVYTGTPNYARARLRRPPGRHQHADLGRDDVPDPCRLRRPDVRGQLWHRLLLGRVPSEATGPQSLRCRRRACVVLLHDRPAGQRGHHRTVQPRGFRAEVHQQEVERSQWCAVRHGRYGFPDLPAR